MNNLQISANQLDIFGVVDQFVVTEQVKTHHKANPEFDREDGFIWEDDTVWQLMEGVLLLSLGHLSDCKPQSKDFKESYSWVNSSDERHPFSFHKVCIRLGYCPEELREQTIFNAHKKLKRLGLESGFEEELF